MTQRREPKTRAGRPSLTELAAAKFVESHGSGGVGILRERAELAAELGHKLAAATWRAMADAAARMADGDLPAAAAAAPPWRREAGRIARLSRVH